MAKVTVENKDGLVTLKLTEKEALFIWMLLGADDGTASKKQIRKNYAPQPNLETFLNESNYGWDIYHAFRGQEREVLANLYRVERRVGLPSRRGQQNIAGFSGRRLLKRNNGLLGGRRLTINRRNSTERRILGGK